ncbi:MAG TPA: PEP-CTERM sorting domain-containing protein [Chthoniobacterales bacterium]|nr:PEP-CTERM sorting domain-containing protein [Chthoniobacterales bacterium]
MNPPPTPKRRLPFVIRIILLALALPSVSFAQSDDFNDGNDAGWTRYNPLSLGTYSFPSGGYRIQAAANPNQQFGPTRAGSFRNDVTYTDFSVSIDIVAFDASLGQAFGSAARATNIGLGSTDGYLLVYLPAFSQLTIQRVDNESPSPIGATGVSLNSATDYRFVFTGIGSMLTGQVFDLANLNTPLATVMATDATYTSGFSGLIVGASPNTPGSAADATFDNYIALVPEPATWTLVVLALVALFGWRRLRRIAS